MTTPVEPTLADRGTSKFGQFFGTIAVSMAVLSAGTTLSWSAPCLSELEDENSTTSFHITPGEASWVGALLAIGALLSAIPAGYCADKFGRKKSTFSLIIPFTLSWILIIMSCNVWMLYAGRILAGMCTGAICVLGPMYISEISEATIRGPLCSFFALFLCTGVLLTFIVATFAKFVMLSTILAICPIIFALLFYFMPETPVYLIKSGKEEEARKSLKFLRGSHADISSEISNIKKELDNSIVEERATLKEILTNQHYFRCLRACVTVFLFQQFSGINAVIFYAVPIFKASKSELDSVVSSIIIALIQVLVTVLVIFIIDKQGRKAYLIQMSVLSCISLGTLGFAFHLMHFEVNIPGLTLIPLISLMVYIFSFSIAMGPIPWLVLGELLSPEINGTISGIAILVMWSAAFIVTKSFGPMMATFGPFITFYTLSMMNALAVVSVYFFVPETRGRSHSDIQKNWNG